MPVEPPLGFSVDEMIPVGEAFEVEQSLLREASDDKGGVKNSTELSLGSPGGEVERTAGATSSPADAAPSLPPSRRKSRRKR